MAYSEYTKKRILHFYRECQLQPSAIVKALEDEGIKVSRSGVWRFLKRYGEMGSIERKRGSGRPSVLTDDIKAIIEETMNNDDETTVSQLVTLLQERGHTLSMRTVLRCRTQLGWTFRGSAYCQLIREGNKVKRLAWALLHLTEAAEGFRDIIFTDETSVQLEAHRRFVCHKVGQAPRPKPR